MIDCFCIANVHGTCAARQCFGEIKCIDKRPFTSPEAAAKLYEVANELFEEDSNEDIRNL